MNKKILTFLVGAASLGLVGTASAAHFPYILGWHRFTTRHFNYTVEYPRYYSLSFPNGRFQPEIKYPASYSKGTNLHNAKIDINTTSSTEAECYQSIYDKSTLVVTSTHQGIVFYEDHYIDAGAGQRNEVEGQYAFHNNLCYRLALGMSYTEISIYQESPGKYPPGAPKEFNRKKIETVFNKLLTTFIFLK